MTAEIAIMNLEAVALAADSAVTAYPGGNRKISTSQNKLFALSNAAPVGVLIYGNASFMSIPWETLIKEYRRRLGAKTFGRLDDYVQDFCRFLTCDIGGYISSDHQIQFIISLMADAYSDIEQQVEAKVIEKVTSNLGDKVPSEDLFTTIRSRLTAEVVTEFHNRASEAQLVDGMTPDLIAESRRPVDGLLDDLRERFFGPAIGPDTISMLDEITDKTIGAMLEDFLEASSGPKTGIVVAGFGEDELFPSLSEVLMEGLVGNILKKRNFNNIRLGPDNRAVIVPFAQSEMIHEFMQGMAPDYFVYLFDSLVSHLDEFTISILENLDRYSEDEREAIKNVLRENYPEIATSFVTQVNRMGRELLADPIVDVVSILPKDQLAEMAEALVSLTSLKRRVSPEEETVGGPTDVAVITKSDGLIWIRRKHYFSADLNPRYLARINRGGYGHATEST